MRLLVTVSALGCVLTASAAVAQPKIGDPAPEPRLESLLQAPPQAGERLLQPGSVVVLDFWATWCQPCLADIPRINRLIAEFETRPVRFVSITDEAEPVVAAFMQQTKMNGWVGIDLDRSAFQDYAVSGLPRTAIVDARGRLAALVDPGQLSAEILESVLGGRSIEPPVAAAIEVPGSSTEPAPVFQVLIRPVSIEKFGERGGRATREEDARHLRAEGISLPNALSLAYDVEPSRIRTAFVIPSDAYDVLVYPGRGPDYAWRGLLRQALESTFGIRARREVRKVEALVLSAIEGRSHRLGPGTPPAKLSTGGGRLAIRDSGIAGLVQVLEVSLRREVIDTTGIEGTFDCQVTWDMKEPDSLFAAIEQQLGLRLEPQLRELELLIVEKGEKGEKDEKAGGN